MISFFFVNPTVHRRAWWQLCFAGGRRGQREISTTETTNNGRHPTDPPAIRVHSQGCGRCPQGHRSLRGQFQDAQLPVDERQPLRRSTSAAPPLSGSGADTYRSYRSNVAMNNGAEHQSMQKYHIPTAAAAVHLLCSVQTRPDLTFSTRPLSDCQYQN